MIKEDREKIQFLKEREEIKAQENHLREFFKLTRLLLEQHGKDIEELVLKCNELNKRETLLNLEKSKMNP